MKRTATPDTYCPTDAQRSELMVQFQRIASQHTCVLDCLNDCRESIGSLDLATVCGDLVGLKVESEHLATLCDALARKASRLYPKVKTKAEEPA